MDLIVNKVVQLEEVDPADGDVVVELLAGTAVVHDALAVLAETCLTQSLADGGLVCAVEGRGGDLPAQSLSRVAEVNFKNLTDIHTGRNAQRVQNDVQRGAVGQVRHILTRQDAGDDALVAVAAGHLVADGYLALLRDIHADDLIDAGAHLVAVFTGEDLDVDYDAALAVGNFERGVAHFARLLAEYCAEQTLLGGQIGLALRSDLADQNVARGDFRADHDYAALVEVLQSVLADAGDIAGDLLGAELGVARVALVLFDVQGGKHVLHDKALVEEDSVLVVVAFPVHVADKDVLAERYLTVGGAGAVSHDVALGDSVSGVDYRALVDAGALVGAGKLDELVILHRAGIVADGDGGRVHAGDDAVALGEDADAGVHGALVLDTGGDDRRLGGEQRNGLTLHVRAHQSTVRVVVFKEGDHRGRDGDHHLGADVDVIDVLAVDLNGIVAVTAGDALVDEHAVLVDRLARLRDDVLVLDVGGHVLDLVGHAAGALLDLAVGRCEEAVLIGAGIGCEVVYKADVRAFRSLYRAETAVMAVVNVTHVEGCALAGQTSGAEGGHTALMRQLREGVGLIHELAERAGAEELLDARRDGTDIDKALGGDDVEILQGHALADDALHAGKADAELVLQQLADAADTAVAQMVDIVGLPMPWARQLR